jgi:hypothetical protein
MIGLKHEDLLRLGVNHLKFEFIALTKGKALSVMMPMPVSVYKKNDGTFGISIMNLSMSDNNLTRFLIDITGDPIWRAT